MKQLVSFAILCLVVFLGYGAYEWFGWREHADWTTGVVLELAPAHQVVEDGEVPHVTVTVVNRGSENVVLVEPGDGSALGRRTPVIEWSRNPPRGQIVCGNITALKADEVFSLKPGEARRLNDWIRVPRLDGPGRYRVAIRYTNQPNRRWDGIPLGEHDEDAMRAVRRSNAVSAVSNYVEIVVEEKRADPSRE